MFIQRIALSLACSLVCGTASAAPPNVVYILADDLGYGDVNAYYPATPIRTPNIDQLAVEGARFTSFYAAPICTPSRAEFLTGRYPVRDGWGAALSPISTDGVDKITIAERLRRNGYTTALIGKWHLGLLPQFNPTLHGFDEFYGVLHGNKNFLPEHFMRNTTVLYDPPVPADFTASFTEETVKFIDKHKNDTDPFFLELAYTDPHTPFDPRTYREVVEGIDASVGRVVDAIKAAGIDQKTLVIFTSDNGPVTAVGGSAGPLRGEKIGTTEGGVRVPFIARWPGRVPHRIVGGPAMNIDMYPTFASLAGLALTPGRLDGEDISPMLFGTGPRPGANEFLFYSMNKLRAFRSGKWKVLINKDGLAGQLYDLSVNLSEDPAQNLASTQVARLQSLAARAKQLDAGLIREAPPKR